jgi:4-carboxymuconolactone decarboxylase
MIKRIAVIVLSLSFVSSASAQTIEIARSKSQTSRQGPAENFTGSVRVDPLFEAKDPGRTTGATVTFESGSRTAWHSHPLGQILIVTSGTGRVQQWEGPIDEIKPGDVVRIPPNVKHWHGASPNASMAHIAIVELLNGKSTKWMDKVTDEQYNKPVRAQSSAPAPDSAAKKEPSRAQQLIGEFSPKLVELTDEVLFGDIWARPQLSPRDRSLVTVSALIAMNRPDQLRSHLLRARENGLTNEELAETITHLAFYAGWPNAISAVTVAKEVLEKK